MSITIFDKSVAGRASAELPQLDVKAKDFSKLVPDKFHRQELQLPELAEIDVVRHYVALSRKNYGIDNGFYPLGSCTMKYNPKINEEVAKMPGNFLVHPLQSEELSQGVLEVMYCLDKYLCEITGMAQFTLQPAAGAHGEMTGLLVMKRYFEDKGQTHRKKILIPDASHGTNPATCTICGFEAVTLKSDERGGVNLQELKEKITDDVAGIMLTNPNTLGLFDENIVEVCKIVHEHGGLTYYDGANLNPVLGVSKPADMGFDIIHINLHKVFSTPHGGGGPGSGPVGVVKKLVPYLPVPTVEKKKESFYLDYNKPKTMGKMKAFYGNYGMHVRAYTYIRSYGNEIKDVAENATLNANYLMHKLKQHFKLPYDRICQHEFVLSDEGMPNGISTMDIVKRLIDYGFHPPTIYFPLIVHGAMMIEPTETESKETLDSFIETMLKIKKEAAENPELVKTAPHTTPVKRLDAVKAAREPVIKWVAKN